MLTAFVLVIVMGADCLVDQPLVSPTAECEVAKVDVEVDDINQRDGIIANEVLLTGPSCSSVLADVEMQHTPLLRQCRGSNRAPPFALIDQA